jgi:hypothetical protein
MFMCGILSAQCGHDLVCNNELEKCRPCRADATRALVIIDRILTLSVRHVLRMRQEKSEYRGAKDDAHT